MQRHTIQVGSFEVNCSFVEHEGATLVIDPGQESDRILAVLEKKGWEPTAILLTHGHFDHVNGIPGILSRFPALPVCVSAEDAKILSHPQNALPPEYGHVVIPARNLQTDFKALAGFPLRCSVIPTPGHTPGGVCYYFPEGEPTPLLFAGDTLFAGSVGRTDLPGGDMATLMRSLDSLLTLPEATVVVPGHGMLTTIGREKASNPFLQ